MWIKGFENRYEITKDGKVFFHKNGKRIERKLVPDKNGYMTINLKIKNKVYCKKIHREVAKTYIFPYDGEQVNHINGIKYDNNVENLEWCSNVDNARHMLSTGLKKIGSKYANNTTGLYGVHESNGKYRARRRVKNKEYHLGTYNTKEEAYAEICKSLDSDIFKWSELN